MAIASLVLGIISIVWGIFGGYTAWVGALIGLVGLILAILGRKDVSKKGIATAGMVCSIVGLALSLIVVIACGALGCAVANM